jgi:general secretion pathway protein D
MFFFLFFSAIGAMSQEKLPADKTTDSGSQRFVSIDFNNVDISVFIKFISELTGKNFVIDQRVKGKVTIISPSKISVEEAYKVFESVLDVHGYATVETGKLTKIIPSPDARTKSIETRTNIRGEPDDDRIVTQLMPLRFANPDDVKRLFTPMVSKSSVILSYAPTNTLIITDQQSNIMRLSKILNTIDIPGVGREITVFPIQNADATKMVSLLETVLKTSAATNKKSATRITRGPAFVADERTNSVIVVASEDDTRRIRTLIQTLDLETPKGKEKIHVYYLEYAAAEELVAVLKDLPQQEGKSTEGKKEAPVVSDKVNITADKATNSLIITADRDDHATLMEIIRQIDIPRDMVYIEALLMEVNYEKAFDLGTEWVVGDTFAFGDDQQGVAGGGFRADNSNISYTPDGDGNLIPVLPPGFAMGVFGEALEISGIAFPSISAIVQAYKKDEDVNILSTPQLLTTDNQEASITVGKNIPFQTTTSTTNNDTYNSFEYRDVGKTLKITPQINKDRMVRLNVSLEVSALESTTEFRPTTLKRTVETTVMVKDKSTVVIGGLIDDNFAQSEYRVPCLGDIPGMGWLFKTRSKANDKTNLFIFITPRVIQNPDEAKTIMGSKKSKLDKLRETQIKLYQGGGTTTEELPSLRGDDASPASAIEQEMEPQEDDIPGITQETFAPPAEEKPPVGSSYFIQVLSFADEVNALEAVNRLEKIGYNAQLNETEVENKVWYRVQVGGYPDRQTALRAQQNLAEEGMTDTIIIQKGR